MREKPKRITQILANYPLTFYLGVLLLFGASLLGWLKIQYGWDIDLRQFWVWASRNAEILLLIVSFLLGATLIASGIAYRKTCKMSQEDYYLWLQQRSTRTLFPFFTPLHDWLRMRSSIYRWWHSQVYSTTFHILLLGMVLFLGFSGVRGIVSPLPGGGGCSDDGGEPAEILISSNTTWSTNQCIASLTVYNNATLTINGGVVVETGTLNVGNGSTNGHIVFKGDTLNNYGVTVIATGNVTVYSGSTVTGNAWGYAGGSSGAGSGTGGGGSASGKTGAGGGYGGTGGSAGGASGGSSYGTATAPDHLGSGGGYGDGAGGNGGAAIKIDTTATFTINGSIQANGGGGTANGGGGSGGTVWIKANTFAGTGSVTANGGNGGFSGGGGGGGGRIVRQYTTAIGTGLTLTAAAGSGGSGAQAGSIQNIGPVQSYNVISLTGSVTAGNSFSVTVAAKDSLGATYTSYTGTISFSSSDTQAVLPPNYTFVAGDNGVKNFTGLILKTAGSRTVTVSEVGNSAVTGSLVITVAPADRSGIVFSDLVEKTVAGTAHSPRVTVVDQYGNTVTGDTGEISFTSSDPQATLPSAYTLTSADAGTKTFPSGIVFRTVGEQIVYANLDGGKFSEKLSTNVSPGAAAVYDLTFPSKVVAAGQLLSPTLRIKDAYGNTATEFKGSVRFTSSDGAATLPAQYSFSGIEAGVKTFTNGISLKTAGSKSVTVQSVGNDSVASAIVTFTVNPGILSAYKVSTTSPQKVGLGWIETVSRVDAYGNVLAGSADTETVTLSIQGPANFFNDQTYTKQLTSLTTNTFQTIYLKAYSSGTVTITVRRVNTEAVGISSKTDLVGSSGPIEILAASDVGNETGTVTEPKPEVRETTGFIERIQDTTASVVETLEQNPETVGAVSVAAAAITPFAAAAAFGPVTTAIVTGIVDTMVRGASFFGGQVGILPMRLRGRRWGRVRNRRTGMPVGGVFVQLLDERGQVVERVMTDGTGHYAFLVNASGRYWIEISNPLYERFMSRPITITDPAEDIVNEDIELVLLEDRLKNRTALLSILLKTVHFLTLLHWPLLILGSALAIYVYATDPTLTKSLIVSLYVFLWATKLLEFNYRRPFGVVIDAKTGQPQAMSVVQIVSTNAAGAPVIRSTVTDRRGRFLFVVRPGRYTLTVGKEGFRPFEMAVQGETADLTIKLERD